MIQISGRNSITFSYCRHPIQRVFRGLVTGLVAYLLRDERVLKKDIEKLPTRASRRQEQATAKSH
jgi:hypothetical protein